MSSVKSIEEIKAGIAKEIESILNKYQENLQRDDDDRFIKYLVDQTRPNLVALQQHLRIYINPLSDDYDEIYNMIESAYNQVSIIEHEIEKQKARTSS